ncbi:uncharacterized protein At1g01500 [Musa acuminata AAA Group]|uniref:(wild Malaysian banana) hypothetical protein n=1 Tax=Musa acuminata subsp. malaccensis TaxID=214687 RepID=A0A804IJS9_MUSAM|nr:PREDICTED: uncharacterized protein At1g01500-like [Musa acuminata subsp. malaccensis]XP_009395006.1 PREDICTED: uncharacterized protein At1g01500-like [Musa acuminata subsp. malaccensis]XP_009395007.1 PREDICTED: uncharacterized protein At1g01500-like [Musa acuminata subsp. malaccensis]XP_009395008.1 PREDICTED: uncharacterized protein At1g01500-like [Musa acuminata subsp. malaccensis]CAG1840878.1 unnamed protein product [Musa acuminata subsp. malaccensis]
MESCDPATMDQPSSPGRKIILHPLYVPKSPPWFDLRVFYVRVSNCQIDESTPEHLTVHHIPLTPDTILEVNGRRSSIYSDYVSSSLRRDRVDKRAEEATFVSTDSIRMTGSIRFEVYDRDCLVLAGILELCNSNGFSGDTKKHNKKWSMNCQSVILTGMSFLKNKQIMSVEINLPMIEVYVAGLFSGAPIVLTKTLQLGFLKKHQMKVMLDSIPEDDTMELKKEMASEDGFELSEYGGYNQETDLDMDYNEMYTKAEYLEGEDGELLWFNAGVRVGVGIGLGVCLGIGIGVGLLVRTYQAATRNFKRRLG